VNIAGVYLKVNYDKFILKDDIHLVTVISMTV